MKASLRLTTVRFQVVWADRLARPLTGAACTFLLCVPLQANYSEDWDSPEGARGYYSYISPGEQTRPIEWLPDHGVDNTGFVFSPLDPLGPDEPTGQFYPLWTFGWTNLDSAAHPVSLTCSPYVTLSVNAIPLGHLGPPHTLMANLNGGSLRFFVGTFETANRYAFFVFKGQSFDLGSGEWTTSTIQVTSDEAEWDRFVPPQPDGPLPVLQRVLDYPQQWGLCIQGAASGPTGWLGFDNLALTQGSLSRFPTNWYVPDEFPTIQHAIVNPKVIWGDTILVRKLDLPYPGQISTKVRDSETDFLPSCPKRLFIRAAEKSSPPVLIYQQTLPPSTNHVWLEFGGEFSDFILQGPGLIANGIGIANPTLVRSCVITNYNAGCLAFCAANAIDEPSGFRYNLIAHNKTGVINGDVQHVFFGNTVRDNDLGFDLISGNSAQAINNLVVFNGTGAFIRSYEAWPTYSEIANNTFYSNAVVGVRMEWLAPAAPISAIIRDNIFAYNGGPAIDANTLYGPMKCGASGLDTNQGGCYAQIRNNLFWMNNGAQPKDPLFAVSNFWYAFDPAGEGKYVMHIPSPAGLPGHYGARMIQCLFEDPRWANNPPWSGTHPWTVADDSPCINAGSTTLRLGYIYVSSEGNPVWDTGALDIGFHSQTSLSLGPLAIRRLDNGLLRLTRVDAARHYTDPWIVEDFYPIGAAKRPPPEKGTIIEGGAIEFRPTGEGGLFRGRN